MFSKADEGETLEEAPFGNHLLNLFNGEERNGFIQIKLACYE